MNAGLSRCIATLLLCLLLAPRSHAEPERNAVLTGLGPNSKTTLVVTTLVVATAAIGVGVYFAIRAGHTVKGCVRASGADLALTTGDTRSFVLLGATAGIKAGDRVKVTGTRKKQINGVTDKQSFVVDKLDKDYGACAVQSATP